jgi:hypothetical protein
LVSQYVGTRSNLLCHSHYQALIKKNEINPCSKKIKKSEYHDYLGEFKKSKKKLDQRWDEEEN